MHAFRYGHAAHPDWRAAAEALMARLASGGPAPTAGLGLLYVTEHLT